MKRIVLFITALLLFAGCAKEQLVEERSYTGPVTVVSATFESLSNGATKAAVTDAGAFTWQNGDKAAFTASTGAAYFTGTNSSNTTTASFAITDAPSFSSTSFAFYPSDLTTGQSTSSLAVKVPTTREWVEHQTNVAMYGAKVENKNSFNFTHMGGLVRVRVNNVPTNARQFVFKTPGYKINGDFTAKNVSNYNVIETTTSTNEGEQTYTLTWTNAPDEDNTMDFYIPLPVGTYSGGFAFKFLDSSDAEILSKTSSQSETIARKDLVLMPAITLMGGEIEPAKKAAVVQEVPAGHSGDFLLANSEKVLLKVNASEQNNNITLKYNGGELPTNLEIQVVGEKAFDQTISGNLPKTHVDFTTGEIANVEMTTSASTFEIVHPAKISEKLTVKGGNVKVKGATVAEIEVAAGAKADGDKAPVEIVVEKKGDNVPAVTNGIKANADVVVAPATDVNVKVTADDTVKVATAGAGTVTDSKGTPIANGAAQIGDIKYATLADAIAAVKEGETITMLGDVAKANGISVPSGKNFTVDFGGYTYTGLDNPAGSTGTTNQVFQLLKNSTITFKNGTIDLATTKQDKFRFLIQNYANLTLEDIILDGTNLAITDRDRYTISNNCGTVEFKGATTIKAAAERGVAFDVCKYMDYSAPTVTWNSTGTVNGGIELSGGKFVVAKNLSVSVPVMAAEGESTLEIGTGATLSAASDFNDPNPNLTNHKSTAPVQVKQGAGLTISGAGTVEGINNVYSAVVVSINGDDDTKAAKLTVSGNVTLKGNYYGVVGNGQRHNTEITVNGGTIKGTYTNDNLGIYHPQAGKLTITGGTIEGYSSAVEVRGGTVNISGGSLTATATTFSCTKNGNGNTTVGAALAIAQHNTRKPISVTIDGGTFTGYKAISVEDPEDGDPQNVNVTINGGTFSDLSGVHYVADNATYTLGADVDNAAGMSLDTKKTFIVNFNNHIYTVNKPGAGSTNTQTQAFQLIAGQNITFKNGTIKAADANLNATSEGDVKPIKRFIQNYANLTLTNMTFDGTNINGENSVVEFCNGNVTIDGTTNFTAKSGVASINVDSWKGSYPNGTAVTINTAGNVGKIHCYTEGTGSMTTKSSLTIKNGKNITIDDVSNGEVTISVEGGEIVWPPVGALKGEFSVGEAKKVHFSRGNLTYSVPNETWAFYEHQYDCATDYDDNLISLFTWGYNKNTSTDPDGEEYVTGHTSVPDQQPLEDPEAWESFSASEDWGSQIGDGKTWRTLTAAEWIYLFDTRKASTVSGTSNARYAKATVASISGIILLPDKYEHPSGVAALTNINTSDAGYTANSYDVTTWAAMEDAGAVFLPAADYREGDEVDYGNTFGSYWSSTACREIYAWCVEFDSTNSNVDPDNNYLYPDSVDERAYGCSVRLVTESN